MKTLDTILLNNKYGTCLRSANTIILLEYSCNYLLIALLVQDEADEDDDGSGSGGERLSCRDSGQMVYEDI
ncbi:hypothetical protein Leryth_027152 [Lithospermum erythrorhizon]|nr:hypothetical protein Leryth_027152 [Lithospermum erythrorhizon]